MASTILPGGSEAALIYALYVNAGTPTQLLMIATIANTLGGMSSWLIGWWIQCKYPLKKMDNLKHQKALCRLKKYGSPILLLSWVPIIGDPLCVAAGWLNIPWPQSLFYMALGKAARYALIIWVMIYGLT